MTNSNPVAKFKRGQKKVPGSGRQSGSMNSFGRDLKEALLDAAQEVGEVVETEILDKDGNSTSFGRDLKEALLDAAQEVVLHGPHIALGESATTS